MNKKLIAVSVAALLTTGCDGVYDNFGPADSRGTIEINGQSEVGQSLTVTVADDDGLSNAVTYTWMADSTVIEGATENAYTVTAAEVGTAISVRAEYVDDKGNDESLIIKAPAIVPEMTADGAVMISGIPDDGVIAFGSELTANVSDTDGIDSTISYQWWADDSEISGATSQTYTTTMTDVGKQISVQTTYTDNLGLVEMPVSDKTNAIVDPTAFSLTMSQTDDITVGTELVATFGGVDATAAFQWYANDAEISGATAQTYTVKAEDLEKTLSVTVTYNSGNKTLTQQANDVIYSTVVTSAAELMSAVTNAAENDVIALASGEYVDVGYDPDYAGDLTTYGILVSTNGVKLTRTKNSDAVIKGRTCIALKGDNTIVDGLVFEENNALVPDAGSNETACDSSSSTDAMLLLNGDGVVVRNSIFKDHVGGTGFDWIELRGTNSIVERNLFSGSDSANNKSGPISIYINTDLDKDQGNIVQYNHFTNITPTSSANSGAYAIQVGRSTGDDSKGVGQHTIQYNLFDGVEVKERLIKVQGGENTIKGNTIINSVGMISLEDGVFNTVSDNIIIPGEGVKSGGIALSALGHTITNNYIAEDAYTGGDRGGIFIHDDMLDNSGNEAAIATYTDVELAVTISSNTLINVAQAVGFDDRDASCVGFPPYLNTSGNLIASTLDTSLSKMVGTESSDFSGIGCSLNSNSTKADNHVFVSDVTDGGTVDISTIVGNAGEAGLTANAQGLYNGSGAQANIGADASQLYVISADDVGPGSSWTTN